MFGAESSDEDLPEGYKIAQAIRREPIKYALPSNDQEIDRMSFQHYLFRYALHGNHMAPMEDLLEDGIKVLDVGCGSGTWSIDMANDYPASTFTGVDMSNLLFPMKSDLPPNCCFVTGNTLEKLPFPNDSFDYVFQRVMFTSFTATEWTRAVAELVRVTKPKGMIELIEPRLFMERSPPSYTWIVETVARSALARGVDVNFGPDHLEDLLVAADLTEVEADYVSGPLGWGGNHGEMGLRNIEILIKALKGTLIRDMTDEDYAMTMMSIRQEVKEYRTWGKLHYAYGTKPAI